MEQNEIREFFDLFLKEQPVSAVLSGQVEKNDFLKVKVRPVLSGGNVRIQIEEFRGKQAFHKNMSTGEASAYLTELMGTSFKQAQAETFSWSGQVLVSKKGKASVKMKRKNGFSPSTGADIKNLPMTSKGQRMDSRNAEAAVEAAWKSGLSHNRKKRYILEEGIAVPFLVDLGVQTKEGKIVNSRYDKFRQINRFLEFIEDILPKLDKSRESTILDFGCGKSYLLKRTNFRIE